MSLYHELQSVKSEEDVKDAYIKALNLKSYTKGLVDIQTDEIWFEAKDKPKSTYEMFAQLLHYVKVAHDKGDNIPPFLAVIDTDKAAFMQTTDILPLFNDGAIIWAKSASKIQKDTVEKISAYVGTHFVAFKIKTHEQEFIDMVKKSIQAGEIIRTHITPDNLKQVFDKWIEMIGKEIEGASEKNYALLFFADIMHDGTKATHDLPAELVHGEKPYFLLHQQRHEIASYRNYREFWQIYNRPPKEKHRSYLLGRRDTLIPIDERSFKGAYYTPLDVVDKAYDLLAETLGENWQKNYIVWDMCCGVGNLEVKHSNPRKIFMSTLDQTDIDVMNASKTCEAATRFQYDYLNDDISEGGSIDYTLSNKMPIALQEAIKAGKKILVLINPPYAEAGSALGKDAKNTVAKTKMAAFSMQHYGKASNELFTQFLARIALEIPTATIAVFSKLKYVNAPNFEKFRQNWNAKYLSGFVVSSLSFDGLKGKFPIGFLIWKTNQNIKKKIIIKEIKVRVFDKNTKQIEFKNFYAIQNNKFLNVWLDRPKQNESLVIPLKNAVSPYASAKYMNKWSDDAIGYMWCQNNDLQHASQQTALFSSTWGDSHGFYITPDNLWQAAVIFSVRRLIKPTWLNDRDQFLQPTQPLSDEFKHDCLIWMLFNGSNLSAGANDLEWNGQKWSIVNHFIPFTEEDVGAPDRFESHFMVDYLKGKKLSKEAKAVLKQGQALWQIYFSQTDNHKTRAELKLNRPDVGWYQMRKALEARIYDGASIDFGDFKTAYEALSQKLQPQVFELGFMRA